MKHAHLIGELYSISKQVENLPDLPQRENVYLAFDQAVHIAVLLLTELLEGYDAEAAVSAHDA